MAEAEVAAGRPAAEELPYTCQHCSNTLADHVLVRDFYQEGRFEKRLVELICGPCGRYALEVMPAEWFKAVRLFALTPAGSPEAP